MRSVQWSAASQLPTAAEPLATALTAASASFGYAAEAALADGRYLRELLALAR